MLLSNSRTKRCRTRLCKLQRGSWTQRSRLFRRVLKKSKLLYLIIKIQADLEEMVCESMVAEERAKKSMIDAARLADELRAEQENAQEAEKNRRGLDFQV